MSIRIISELQNVGAVVQSYDPVVKAEMLDVNTNVKLCDSAYAVADKADALVILTGWQDFVNLDYQRIYSDMATPCIVDSRNLLDAAKMVEMGFKYMGVGTSGYDI